MDAARYALRDVPESERASAAARLDEAQTDHEALERLIVTWIELQLRQGALLLSGRSDPTAPVGAPVAPERCRSLRLAVPSDGAVTLADGEVLLDARLTRPAPASSVGKAYSTVKAEIADLAVRRRAEGRLLTQREVEDLYPGQRQFVRDAFLELGLARPRGRPKKRAE